MFTISHNCLTKTRSHKHIVVQFVDIATMRRKIVCEASHDLVFTSDTNEVALRYINYQTTLSDFTVSWESIQRDVTPGVSVVFD